MINYNIVLTGMTGVGKTTIGKALAEYIGKQFWDLDKNIEQSCGVDIPTIFAIEGESGFRNRETKELKCFMQEHDNFVLSVGGGCILSQENRRLITNGSNVVIQLYADIETLVKRLSKSATKRPLLNSTDLEKKALELYESRCKFYETVTDIKINTSQMKSSHVVKEIIQRLKIA